MKTRKILFYFSFLEEMEIEKQSSESLYFQPRICLRKGL